MRNGWVRALSGEGLGNNCYSSKSRQRGFLDTVLWGVKGWKGRLTGAKKGAPQAAGGSPRGEIDKALKLVLSQGVALVA